MKDTEQWKRSLIPLFGSACQRCGYTKCLRALQFHHTDSSHKKDYSSTGLRTSLAEVEQYPDRFILLCANCHFEHHDEIDRENRIYLNCLACGTPFRLTRPCRAERDKYCSKKCQHAHRPIVASTPENILDRIHKNILKSGECWEWTAYAVKGSTPVINMTTVDGVHVPRTVARVLYELEHGSIPENRRLKRHCHNHKCVRIHPEHVAL